MNPERDRFGSLATRLRREAAADRPAFSAEWHERLLRRLAVEGKRQRAVQPTVAGRSAAGPRRRWFMAAPLAAALVAAVAVMVLVDAQRDRRIVREGQGARASTGGARASLVAEADGGVGLERLPMFDEIDAGVRDGVVSLAASLLEVPEWTTLADFDARTLLDPDEGAGKPVAR